MTITSPTTRLQRALKTGQEGRFNFPQLRPGTSVKVEAEGFDPQQDDNVSSGLGHKQEVNFTLRVAHSEQSVQVSFSVTGLSGRNGAAGVSYLQ